MANFVHTVARPANRFIVHARKAVLQGLSPRENRTVPPLRYDDVYRLKADFPMLRIEINGGITTLLQATAHLQYVDGAMLAGLPMIIPIFSLRPMRSVSVTPLHHTPDDKCSK